MLTYTFGNWVAEIEMSPDGQWICLLLEERGASRKNDFDGAARAAAGAVTRAYNDPRFAANAHKIDSRVAELFRKGHRFMNISERTNVDRS